MTTQDPVSGRFRNRPGVPVLLLLLLVCGGLLSWRWEARALTAPSDPFPVRTQLLRQKSAAADTFRIERGESLFAVVTRRAGPLARFAHDHLVHATRYEAHFTLDRHAPETAAFTLRVATDGLVVDDPDRKEQVEARLIELGILNEPFQSVNEGERRAIREEMLHRDQLNAGAHPEIRFRARNLRPVEGEDFDWELEIEMTLRDVTRSTPARARLQWDEGRVRVEATATFRFTDFGIEPYSAYFGAVRNRDPFHLFLSLVAVPTREVPEEEVEGG